MTVTTDAPDPRGDADRAADLMADVSLWTADDWRRLLDAAASGATVDGLLRPPAAYPRIDGAFLILGPECFTGDGIEQTQDVIMWRGAHYRRSADTARTWIGEAHAAFDQAATEAGMRRQQPEPDFWVARASAAATLASAEQARIGNLIAWKQLRQSAPTSALPGGGDAIADEIEAALGIAAPPTPQPTLTPDELALILDGLGGIASGDAGSYPEQMKAEAAALAARLGGSAP
jgi:hypothetical protein